mmetsp:Transcript_4687/g.10935  ORF Transcript_4687/g.10935 Transcript_4687/m.10935 type:complete len:204 (-) Transcript_4687:101-712(-)
MTAASSRRLARCLALGGPWLILSAVSGRRSTLRASCVFARGQGYLARMARSSFSSWSSLRGLDSVGLLLLAAATPAGRSAWRFRPLGRSNGPAFGLGTARLFSVGCPFRIQAPVLQFRLEAADIILQAGGLRMLAVNLQLEQRRLLVECQSFAFGLLARLLQLCPEFLRLLGRGRLACAGLRLQSLSILQSSLNFGKPLSVRP